MATAAQREKLRNRRDHRGSGRYGRRHLALRKELAPVVAAGLAKCARCGEPIEGEWDLGHDDRYPWLYAGPEHREL